MDPSTFSDLTRRKLDMSLSGKHHHHHDLLATSSLIDAKDNSFPHMELQKQAHTQI